MNAGRALPAGALAGLVSLVGLLVAGCGSNGGSAAPKDASKADFCAAYTATPDLSALGQDSNPRQQAKKLRTELQRLSAELAKTGTPEDIPKDARHGFEVSIDAVDDLDEADLARAIESNDSSYFDKILTGDDRRDADAFDAWASDYCS